MRNIPKIIDINGPVWKFTKLEIWFWLGIKN